MGNGLFSFWIYSNEKAQSGVSEKELISKATEYLHLRRFEDISEAEFAAKEFIEFCHGRAWVFSDTGSTKGGEAVYHFTHRTFLEYFTAEYISRISTATSELEAVLFPKIAKGEWDIVAQLAIQIHNKSHEDSADQFLDNLIDEVEKNDNYDAKRNIVFFSSRCLEFLVPTPRVTKKITKKTIAVIFLFSHIIARDDLSINYGVWKKLNPEELISPLLNVSSENLKLISDCLERIFTNIINNDDAREALVAYEISLNYRMYFISYTSHIINVERTKFWDKIFDKILENNLKKFYYYCEKFPSLCINAAIKNKISIEILINFHGLGSVFKRYHTV